MFKSHLHFKVFVTLWTVGHMFSLYFRKTDGSMAVRTFAIYVSVAVLPFSFLQTEEACRLIVLIHVVTVFFLACFKVPGETSVQKEDNNNQPQCIEDAASGCQV